MASMAGSGTETPVLAAWSEVCSSCGRTWPLTDRRWVCPCGGLLDLVGPLADPFERERGASGESPAPASPLLRYQAALPPGAASVDLGMCVTPVSEVRPGVFLKADQEHPTGSFKDRGASVMIGVAARLGVDSVVVDSSGNAGRAAAAHAGRAGLACTVFVPAGTSPEKLSEISGYGATVVEVPGGRAAAAAAAQEEVRASGRWYASHVHQPLFHHGVKTLAFELFEQIPGLDGGEVIVPAGNGTLVLGLWLGFGELVALGRLRCRPALVAVQADRCPPLAGLPVLSPVTSAAGIAIPVPPRAGQIRAAVLASGGRVVTVSEDAIGAARAELSGMGLEVDATGAVAWAARTQEGEGRRAPSVVVLTGR